MKTYSKQVLENFRNPSGLGKPERIDSHGRTGNIICGDVTDIYLMVKDKKLEDVRFETLGCAAAIATANILCTLAKGKDFEEALDIETKEIIKTLKGLPESKHHCSELAVSALREAIYNYLKNNDESIPEKLEQHHNKALKEQEEFNKKFTKEYREQHGCVC